MRAPWAHRTVCFKSMKPWVIGVGVAMALVLAAAWVTSRPRLDRLTGEQAQPVGGPAGSPVAVSRPAPVPPALVEVIADNLEIPWEVAWLPTGEMLVTERPGRLVMIDRKRTVIPVAGVAHVGEGGLLGMAVHPRFGETQWLYLYHTTRVEGGLRNRVVRYRLVGAQLTEPTTIVGDIPGSQFHDGGRIAFGPQGYLYITTGDAGREALAQDRQSVAGKILRVRDDGSLPPDNPFGNAVYSLGHRNAQGLAWDDTGRLWATEHGRSGVKSGLDEINLVSKGKNYGWPVIEGDTTRAGMNAPVVHSGPTVTWAPAGVVWESGRLWFAGLKGESLYEAAIDGSTIAQVLPHFAGQFGRLRAVAIGLDGFLYVTTSNRDGRGEPQMGDDKVLKIDLKDASGR